MARLFAALGGCLLLAASAAGAADNSPAGTWKLSFPTPPDGRLTFLIMLSESDKGWIGDLLGTSEQMRVEPTIEKIVVKDDSVSFDVKLGPSTLSFDGKLAKDGKKIRGSFAVGGNTILVDLVPSKLKNLSDKFALAKETLEQADGGQEYFDAAFNVLAQATTKKMMPDDVRALADKTAKLAEGYGPRWQRAAALKIASALADQEAFAPVVLEQARQAERMLRADEDSTVQMQVLSELAAIFKKAKKADELKPIEARLIKLEARDFAEYAKKNPPFKPDEFKGRKNKSSRVVLVEEFIDCNVATCVAAELAGDAIQMRYKPTEVALLQYHVPTGGLDPLTNREAIERTRAYKIMALPMVFFSGKRDDTGKGSANAAKAKFGSFCETIDELLEKPAGAKLQLSATQKGNEISIKASVSELANPGATVFLRFALTEDRVRFLGANGLRYHQNVVRAMPGGVKGVALEKKASDHTATVDLTTLREGLVKFLDEITDGDAKDFPLVLRNFHVTAFVQDDASGDVLQAAQVEVEEKKAE
jgi:hypothetical protein